MANVRPGGDPAKHRAILEAAANVFRRTGYRGGMDMVAREAGVSKQTIYSHFGSKEALFEAMIRSKSDDLVAPMHLLHEEVSGLDDPSLVLASVARGFMRFMLDEKAMAMFRLMVGESERFPNLAAVMFRSGPKRVADELAGYLARLNERGVLNIDDSANAAWMFFGLLRGETYIRGLLGLGLPLKDREIDAHIRRAVAVFLDAHAPKR